MQARARVALAGATVKIGRHVVDAREEQGRQVVLMAGFDSALIPVIAGADENSVLLPSRHDTLAGPTYEESMRSELS
jgi:hypothetical protein